MCHVLVTEKTYRQSVLRVGIILSGQTPFANSIQQSISWRSGVITYGKLVRLWCYLGSNFILLKQEELRGQSNIRMPTTFTRGRLEG